MKKSFLWLLFIGVMNCLCADCLANVLPSTREIYYKKAEVENQDELAAKGIYVKPADLITVLTTANTEWELADTDAARGEHVKKIWAEILQANGVSDGDNYQFKFIVEPDEKIAAIKEPYEKIKAEEYYTLELGEKIAVIKSPSIRGIFYALMTLRQFFWREKNNDLTLPQVAGADFPAFALRGFMIDVGRNYAPLSLLKTIADFMALYKLNVFHWHFTEDPAWRLESKIYPQINDAKTMTRMAGKFYTQDEFKEFVEYCRVRNILVIPEMDMPGHTAAFRKAFDFAKMEDERATKILCELIAEMASLVSVEQMPYIHIGTDEVKAHEKVSEATLKKYYDAVSNAGRRMISWSPGLLVKGDQRPLLQTWTGRKNPPPAGYTYIDSQENYLNHTDPFEAATLLYFRQNCAFPDRDGIGGILCWWPDIELAKPENHFLQSSIFSSLMFYSEAMWTNLKRPKTHPDNHLLFYTNLPPARIHRLTEFSAIEERVLYLKEKFHRDLPFPYVRQADLFWKTIGPFPNAGDVKKSFPVEEKIALEYVIEDKNYRWHDVTRTGATLIYKHYADYPTFLTLETTVEKSYQDWSYYPHYESRAKIGDPAPTNATMYALTYFYAENAVTIPVWISGHTWSAAERKSGVACIDGEWFNQSPQFFVNDKSIPAPKWQVNNRKDEEPYLDENYWFRAPTMVNFQKGWNKILVKSPTTNARRWMFTFVPITTPDAAGFAVDVKRSPLLRAATPQELEIFINQ